MVGTLPELLGYNPTKLYLQVEGQPTYLNTTGYPLDTEASSGAVFVFTVDTEAPLPLPLYIAHLRDIVTVAGEPVESVIWTGFAVFNQGSWTLSAERPPFGLDTLQQVLTELQKVPRSGHVFRYRRLGYDLAENWAETRIEAAGDGG
jgi:hypothetical protein